MINLKVIKFRGWIYEVLRDVEKDEKYIKVKRFRK